MKIKNSIEKEDGTYVYEGELTGKELEFIVEYGINHLMAQGALPFVTEDEIGILAPGSDTPQ